MNCCDANGVCKRDTGCPLGPAKKELLPRIDLGDGEPLTARENTCLLLCILAAGAALVGAVVTLSLFAGGAL